MSGTAVVLFMTFLFLTFGYMGVPVAFSLLAGVLLGAMWTDVSHTALIQKMFDGMDSEALLAIPFFLLVGELMSMSPSELGIPTGWVPSRSCGHPGRYLQRGGSRFRPWAE